ncbi:MAG: hypothetical protein IT450_23890 [Phycisphaerales bacterium]|nr:hypothetical protein [Phycisphaerales bacterium]
MRSITMNSAFCTAFLLSLAAGAAAQTSIPWHTIDGGVAEVSTGGGFSLRGTVGQADAGFMAGADLTVVGGYWTPAAAGSPPCTGDIDGDGSVGLADLTQMLAAFGSCLGDGNYAPAIDLNGSGCIELADLGQLLSVFGSNCP